MNQSKLSKCTTAAVFCHFNLWRSCKIVNNLVAIGLQARHSYSAKYTRQIVSSVTEINDGVIRCQIVLDFPVRSHHNTQPKNLPMRIMTSYSCTRPQRMTLKITCRFRQHSIGRSLVEDVIIVSLVPLRDDVVA